MKYLKMLILTAIVFTFISCGEDCQPVELAGPMESTIKIGVILSETGKYNIGANKAAFELALEEIEASITATGSNVNIEYQIADDQSNPDTCLAIMEKMHEEDSIKIFFGFSSSEILGSVIDYINTNNLFALSISSTSNAYAIEDNVFRFIPSDKVLANVYTQTFKLNNINHVIPLVNDMNIACTSLATELLSDLDEAGIQHSGGIHYNPYNPNYSAVIDLLRQDLVENVLPTNTDTTIAVFMSSTKEYIEIIEEVDESLLKTVKWYGSDGTYIKELFESEKAVAFADDVNFLVPILANQPETKDLYIDVNQKISEKAGFASEPYGAITYDAAKLLLNVAILCKNADIDVLKEQFVIMSNRTCGATGISELDEFGDRKFGTFDFNTPEKVNDEWQWTNIYKVTNR